MTKKETSPDSMSQTTVAIIAVVTLVIGFGAGYVLFSGQTTETTEGGTTAESNKFVYDESKINGITNLFSDYFYVYSQGQPVEFTYDSYYETDNYVNLVYVFNGQAFDVYISKDYKYLYPSVLEYNEFKAEVDAAKAQMGEAPETAEPEELEQTDTPEVLLFVMSFCPYGNVAEDAMGPVVNAIGDSMYFEPVYIVSGGPGAWSSLHGQVELNQDVREKIIYNLYGPEAWMEYVLLVNAQCDYTNADECWTGPAEAMGINVSEVEALFGNSSYVDELLTKDATLGGMYGVRGSPTLIINGMTMSVARTPDAYKTAVCSADLTPDENCSAELSAESAAPTGSCG